MPWSECVSVLWLYHPAFCQHRFLISFQVWIASFRIFIPFTSSVYLFIEICGTKWIVERSTALTGTNTAAESSTEFFLSYFDACNPIKNKDGKFHVQRNFIQDLPTRCALTKRRQTFTLCIVPSAVWTQFERNMIQLFLHDTTKTHTAAHVHDMSNAKAMYKMSRSEVNVFPWLRTARQPFLLHFSIRQTFHASKDKFCTPTCVAEKYRWGNWKLINRTIAFSQANQTELECWWTAPMTGCTPSLKKRQPKKSRTSPCPRICRKLVFKLEVSTHDFIKLYHDSVLVRKKAKYFQKNYKKKCILANFSPKKLQHRPKYILTNFRS